ncbi:MAG: von Willebrand factor type A domain-containing protein [Acidimicrobiaceae bacterium]|nr:von Willebrand factor type A domain-containing protein [Acidimicrobiaceae bacterium]
MGTTGIKSFATRPRRCLTWLGAVLALSLLAVSCTGGDEDEAASVATSPAVEYGAESDAAPSDVGGDRNSSGSIDMPAASTTSASRTYAEEPMVEEEPMPEAAADYALEAMEAASAEASEAAVQAAEAALAAAAAQADSTTSGVSRQEAAASDRERAEERRRRCPECGANTFEDYGVNPFVDTYEDDLSTFALDVDTASYVVTRNFLEGGQLPPIEAVRVEEFVNYFDGGYQALIDEFNITLEAAPTPFSDPDRVMLRVGVQAPEVLSDLVIPDSVVLVLDRSGSMGQSAGPSDRPMERMSLVHESVELLLGGLPGRTRVGIVAYNDRASVILEPTRVSGNADWIIDEVRSRVRPDGSTNAEAGLVWGFDMALSEADEGRNVLVLLLSDGVANVGATRTDDILEQIGERGDIGLSTIGVGLGPFNDELMEQLANKADGTYHYIDTPDEARRIFVENLNAMLASVARDAKIQVEFDRDKVISYRLLGFENRAIADEDFRDDTRDAGEVGVGQSSTALYEVTLDRGWDRSRGAIATATLRYRRPASERITETWASLHPDDVEHSFRDAGAHFRLAVVAAEFAEVLRDSPFVEDRSMEELAYQADRVADELRRDADAEELAGLIDAARRIRRR